MVAEASGSGGSYGRSTAANRLEASLMFAEAMGEASPGDQPRRSTGGLPRRQTRRQAVVPKQSHPVAKQCHPIGKQEHRVGHLLELASLSEYILGVVIGHDNQFLYALLCHFMDLLLCMHLLEFFATH